MSDTHGLQRATVIGSVVIPQQIFVQKQEFYYTISANNHSPVSNRFPSNAPIKAKCPIYWRFLAYLCA